MDKQDILEGIAFYREAPPEMQTGIASVARYARLAPGDVLFREGEAPRHVAALGAGSVRVFRIGSAGREVTLYHVRGQQASLVGMLSVLLGRPTIATAQAEVATEAVLFPTAALREWVNSNEAVRRFVFETVTQALVDVTSLLEDVVFRSMDSRLDGAAARPRRRRWGDRVAARGHCRRAGHRARGGQPSAGGVRARGGRAPLAGQDRDPR